MPGKRVHFLLVHLDIIGGKVWIEKNNTEDSVAAELVQKQAFPNRKLSSP